MGAFLFYRTQNEIIISFIKYDNNINQIKEILLNNNGYSNDIRHSDFIKLSDRKICLFSVSSSFEEIKIMIIKNYEGELFQLKEYKLNIYEKNRLKIIGGLKTTIFNGFIAMTLTAQLNYNSIKNSFLLILNYPNSEDSEFDITDYIINYIDPQINFNEKGGIENNIFNFTYSGFIIYDFPEGMKLIDSSENKEIIRNVTLFNNIIIQFKENISFDNDLIIEFALTAKEPECQIYNNEIINDENVINNDRDCIKEKDFQNLKTYVGKLSYLKIIIDWTGISKICRENCYLCNRNMIGECYICKKSFIRNPLENGLCIEETTLEEYKPSSQILNDQISSNIIENEEATISQLINEQNEEIFEIENKNEMLKNEETNYIIETEKKSEILKIEKTNNIIETEKKSEIINECNKDDIINNKCTNGKININQYEDIKKSLFIANKNSMNKNTIIKTETLVIQLSSLDEQKNSDNSNISSIDLGDCEDKIRIAYNISSDDNLIIYKVDIKSEDLSNTYVIYEIYDSSLNLLNLSHCQDSKISISVPVQLQENIDILINSLSYSGYNIFDEEDSFYNDICSTYTSQNGADMLLSDRKTDIYTNIQNQTFCQLGCELESYNSTSKKAKCNCDIKNEEVTQVTVAEESFSKKEIAQSFYKTLKNSNFQVLKCLKLIFDISRIKNNYGEILMTVLFLIFLILWIVYCIKGPNSIYQIINDILKTKDLYSNIKNKNNISIYEQYSKSTNQIKDLKFSSQNSKSIQLKISLQKKKNQNIEKITIKEIKRKDIIKSKNQVKINLRKVIKIK